jgi:hypothetical protein
MDRREVLRVLGGVLALPALHGLTADDAWALGRSLHGRIEGRPRVGRVLTDAQMRTVRDIAERIIPATDTPGAAAARVDEFIDLMLAEWYDDDGRVRFLDGLLQLEGRSHARHGTAFAELTAAQQTALLEELDAEVEALRVVRTPIDAHFFQQMKWLTVHGYYTSEVGVMQELQWMPIPGGYDPCRAYVPRTVGGL